MTKQAAGEQPDRLLLLDGHSLAYRAFFALPPENFSTTTGQPTNAVYLDMRARATGDFRLDVTFTSPAGGLVLASTHVTVRSVSTSLVAVGLSAAAVVVLLVWWGRTVWRRHPAARGAHARRPGTGRAGS